jgi:hypothetical protein
MRRAAVLALVAALACAAPAFAHTYDGKSAKGGAMHIRIGPDGAHVIALSAERELSCRKGRLRSFREGVFRQVSVFVRRTRGTFFRGSVRTHAVRGSQVRRGRFSIRFVANDQRAGGVFRERVRLRGGTRCTTALTVVDRMRGRSSDVFERTSRASVVIRCAVMPGFGDTRS